MHTVQNRDFIVLIMCNEFNAITCLKLKLGFIFFSFVKIILI
jgi:hypothetical protein